MSSKMSDSQCPSDNTRQDSLYSRDYDDLDPASHWFALAKAYLDNSLYLFSGMREGSLNRSIYHAKAAAFLFEQSIELFLKAGIVQAGKEIPIHHDLEKLYQQFSNLYPGKRYEFRGSLQEAIHSDPNHPYPEFTRYPANRHGRLFNTPTHFSPDIWHEELCLFSQDYDRIEPLLKERYPVGPR